MHISVGKCIHVYVNGKCYFAECFSCTYGIEYNQSVYGTVVADEFECTFVVRKLMNSTALALCETVHITPCEC